MAKLFTATRNSTGANVSAGEIVGFVLISALAAVLLFLLAVTASRSLSDETLFTCIPDYGDCTSNDCEVQSFMCQETSAGTYPDKTCSNECENAFACVDDSCALVGPGRGNHADLTCDESCGA